MRRRRLNGRSLGSDPSSYANKCDGVARHAVGFLRAACDLGDDSRLYLVKVLLSPEVHDLRGEAVVSIFDDPHVLVRQMKNRIFAAISVFMNLIDPSRN